MAITVKEANVPESQKCEHKNAKHHSRGKCRKCYPAFRKAQWQRKTKLSKQWAKSPFAAALVLFVICLGSVAQAQTTQSTSAQQDCGKARNNFHKSYWGGVKGRFAAYAPPATKMYKTEVVRESNCVATEQQAVAPSPTTAISAAPVSVTTAPTPTPIAKSEPIHGETIAGTPTTEDSTLSLGELARRARAKKTAQSK